MTTEVAKPLDTSLLQEKYTHESLPAHERFGQGQRYQFGSTRADVYSDPPELSPVVVVRMVRGTLLVGDVLHVLPTEAGGVHVDHANGACEIGKTGDVAMVYTAPSMLRESMDGPVRKDVYGRSFTQTSMEVEGTPEGTRVQMYGSVEDAPKPVNTKRGSPLQFVLIEYDPAHPQEPLRHEVWATHKGREELQRYKLKPGDSIEAVLYRHTWQVELQSGEVQTHTRHNLATLLKVDRKKDAKRTKTEQSGTREE